MVLSIIAFLLFLLSVILFKALRVLPVVELRRQVQSGNRGLGSIYKAASYGVTMDIVLWLAASVFLGTSVVLSLEANVWAAVLIIFLATGAITFFKLPLSTNGPAWLLAKIVAKPALVGAGILHPLTSAVFKSPNKAKFNTASVFDKQDLVNLIKAQKNLESNRISTRDLQVVEAALQFSGKSVSQAMATGTEQCFVSGNESVGPLLMDELHARGRFAYLVTKGLVKKQGSKPVGTLFLRDLVGHHVSGQVKDIAQEQVYYINENQAIGDALEAMLKTQYPILAVINSFEEVSGVISLEDIIEQLLPDFMGSDFDNYANPKAVASWRQDKLGDNEKHRTSSEKTGHTV